MSGKIMWGVLFALSLFVVIMSMVWFILISHPSKLTNLTWLYGWTFLVLGIIGVTYTGFVKLKLDKKGMEYYQSKKKYF